MKMLLEASELSKIPSASNELIVKQIKLTNISTTYISDLKLLILDNPVPIVESAIIRERGALSFEGNITLLEMGNLAPAETAYFEYTFKSTPEFPSLSNNILLTYYDDCTGINSTSQLNHLLNPSSNSQ